MTLKWLLCIFCPLSFGTMVLALECESYDQKCQASDSTATVNTTCSSLQRCDHTPGKVPACFALFGRNIQGELSVVKKGCVQNSTPNCRPSSVCSVQERGFPKASPSAFYCCCTEDRCNRDVILFVTEAKDKSSDIQGSIRKLTLLIWAQFVIVAMVSSLTATAWLTHKIISVKRQRHSSHSLQTLGDKGAHRLNNRSHWARKDFELITCLLRSKFGEIWKARPHGSNQVVRIRLTEGSDDVYVYDRLIMTRETNDHVIKIV